MIPSSITVNVTLVLMEAPVKIWWMDMAVIVRLVSKDADKGAVFPSSFSKKAFFNLCPYFSFHFVPPSVEFYLWIELWLH